MSRAYCYYCGRPATSIEHVPPKCIFPEKKDSFGDDHRKNLITVPSCDEHNTCKSKEDEFLMMCLTPIVGNNCIGYVQTRTKLSRAAERNGGRLVNAAFPKFKELKIIASAEHEFPVLIGEADAPRLCNALEHVARGIYFHHAGKRFIGKVVVIPAFLKFQKNKQLELIKLLSGSLIRNYSGTWSEGGENKGVFVYKIGPIKGERSIPMVMTFFGSAEVYVSFERKTRAI